MMEAVRTSETSVDNHFTRQYNPEDSSEHGGFYMNIPLLNLETITKKIILYSLLVTPKQAPIFLAYLSY
jgi:hypothetical protein